jgi:hypothetical protein
MIRKYSSSSTFAPSGIVGEFDTTIPLPDGLVEEGLSPKVLKALKQKRNDNAHRTKVENVINLPKKLICTS